MASSMASTTRYILLTRTRHTRLLHEVTPLGQPPETAKEQSKRRMVATALLSDRLTDSLYSSALLSREVPPVQMPLPPFRLLLLPHVSVSLCKSAFFLQGHSAASTRCLRLTQPVSLVSQSVLSLSHTFAVLHWTLLQLRYSSITQSADLQYEICVSWEWQS